MWISLFNIWLFDFNILFHVYSVNSYIYYSNGIQSKYNFLSLKKNAVLEGIVSLKYQSHEVALVSTCLNNWRFNRSQDPFLTDPFVQSQNI